MRESKKEREKETRKRNKKSNILFHIKINGQGKKWRTSSILMLSNVLYIRGECTCFCSTSSRVRRTLDPGEDLRVLIKKREEMDRE